MFKVYFCIMYIVTVVKYLLKRNFDTWNFLYKAVNKILFVSPPLLCLIKKKKFEYVLKNVWMWI